MSIVSLFESLASEILSAEENFLKNPKDFTLSRSKCQVIYGSICSSFSWGSISSLNEQIFNSSWRDGKYVVHRQDKRTLISSVGDITFDCTYYRGIGKYDGFTHLVEDYIDFD